jgi:hypothetical protein
MGCALLVRDIGGVFVDVVVSEEVTASMEIPQHPVENGAKISDHAYRVPIEIQLTCAASGDPIATYRALFEIMKAAQPFDIMTGFDLFENMLIESLTPSRDCGTGAILQFDAHLKEVIIVSTQAAGASGKGGDERGSGKNSRGHVQASSVDTSTSSGADILDRMQAI